MNKQYVLFMTAAPSNCSYATVIDFIVFFCAKVYDAISSEPFVIRGDHERHIKRIHADAFAYGGQHITDRITEDEHCNSPDATQISRRSFDGRLLLLNSFKLFLSKFIGALLLLGLVAVVLLGLLLPREVLSTAADSLAFFLPM